MSTQRIHDQNTTIALTKYGLTNCNKIANSLQGSIWSAERTGKKYIIKVTSKHLHHSSSMMHNGQSYTTQENIKTESKILKYISSQTDSPDTIVKYIELFQSSSNYYLVMENGGNSLYNFVVSAHALITDNKLDISEWQKCVNIIFKQILNTIHYIHSKGVAHFDISLENIVINDVKIIVDTSNDKIKFCLENIKIKIIDFGLAEFITSSRIAKFVGKQNYKSPEIISGKRFNPFANDIWCAGICLFIMCIGCFPFNKASLNDELFGIIISNKTKQLLNAWGKINYVDTYIIDVFASIFKYECKRISLETLLAHPWVNTN